MRMRTGSLLVLSCIIAFIHMLAAQSATRADDPAVPMRDRAGNLYVSDTAAHVIRKITPDGVSTILAGAAGESGSVDGTGTAARFCQPEHLSMDTDGNIYVHDRCTDRVRKIAPGGIVTTVTVTAPAPRADIPPRPSDIRIVRGGWRLDDHDIVWSTDGTVLQFRKSNDASTASGEPAVYRETSFTGKADTALVARFDLGNTSPVRKRVTVMLTNRVMSDSMMCTFWLPPRVPLRTYGIRTHTTQAWPNASIYFYAASDNGPGDVGNYLLDNVVVGAGRETQSISRTDCLDPTAPAPSTDPATDNLIQNGRFENGSLAPWFVFGDITSEIRGNVFQFFRPGAQNQPAGLVAQQTNAAIPANQTFTASFELGNTSAIRQRVTVVIHERDFSDLTACSFWIPPQQPLSTYMMRSFTNTPWTNATLSVYPGTLGGDRWLQLDDVTLQRTPSAHAVGTECVESVPPVATVDVRAFGAVGNGVTDDTAALQAAMAVAARAGGGVVHLPAGIYLVTSSLDLPTDSVLTGDGRGVTVIRSTSTNAPILFLTHHRQGVSNLTIQGPGSSTNGTGHGILAGSNELTIDGVEVTDIDGIGINAATQYSTIRNSIIRNTSNEGINLSGGSAYNDITSNSIHDTRYAGIGVNGSFNVIHENDIYNCGGGLLDVNDWSGIVVHFASGASFSGDGNEIRSNSIHDNAGSGIQVSGTSNNGFDTGPFSPRGTVIEGNVIWGHNRTPPGWLQWPAGIAVHTAGDDVTVVGNYCADNYFNFSFAGWGGFDGHGLIVQSNTSMLAVHDGYYFSDNPWNERFGAAQQSVVMTNNVDAYAGRDGFRFENPVFASSGYYIQGNAVQFAGGFSYHVTNPEMFTGYVFDGNDSENPALGSTSGISFVSEIPRAVQPLKLRPR